MSLFVNQAKRSASELLADHAACRQLRHLSKPFFRSIIEQTSEGAEKVWADRPPVKHPDPNNLCTNCGRPRSRHSTGPGLCYRCFASNPEKHQELWVEDVFITAIRTRGFTCDACAEVHRPTGFNEARRATIHMLENMDGAVKPVLCPACEQTFKAFCSTNYGSRAWHTAHPRDLEKMAIGWFALKVKLLAVKVFQNS